MTLSHIAQVEASSASNTLGLILYLAIVLLVVAGIWKSFSKAGKPGWASLIPVYNLIVLLEIAQKPLWYVILFFVPIVNVIVAFMVMIAVAGRFGKSAGFGVGLTLLGFIFWPILGFGDAQVQAGDVSAV